MSGKLDQPLDSIIDSQKKAKRDVRRRVKSTKAGKTAAPAGGVKKSVKSAKPGIKAVPGASSKPSRMSKIVVSGLPTDVDEDQIKEYFQKSVGIVRKASLHFNRNGQSRGIADVLFGQPGSAAKAAKELNGVRVDGKPMKIEVVVDADSVPAPEQAKSLSERVAANPKAQPKSATATKATDSKKAKGKQAKPKKARASRPKPKTAEELDAEMTDYWGGNNAANGAATEVVAAAPANGAPAVAATGDDMGMEEIS